MPSLLSLNSYHYRRGGSDVVYFEHDLLFRELGWKTAVMAMKHPRNERSEWSEYFVEEIEFGNHYGLVKTAINASKVVYSFEAVSRLRRLLSAFPVDVAHVHCVYHHLSPSVLWTLHKARIPVVLTAHDLKVLCPAYKMLNQGGICERCKSSSVLNVVRYRCVHNSLAVSGLVGLEALLHRRLKTYEKAVNVIVVPSEFFYKKFIEWGWSEDKLRIVRNFVEEPPALERGTPEGYCLYFGRLAREKGVSTLLRAASRANVALKIAGTGPEERRLKEEASAQGVKAEFLGYCAGDSLRRLIQQARYVVLPSEWYENNPMSVLEAFAHSRPVVGARIGGIPELVKEEETGLLFESGSVSDLARALTSMSERPDAELDRFGMNGLALVREQYSRANYASRMLQIYRELGVSC